MDEMDEVQNCQRCGEPLGGLTITVCNEDGTKEVICASCDAFERKTWYQRERILTTRLVINAKLGHYDYDLETKVRILSDYSRVMKAIKRFEKAVWFRGGLHVYIKSSDFRGHRMETPGVKALAYETAGRVLMTLSDQHDTMDISMIMAETGRKRNGGMQSIHCTAEQAIWLTNTIVTDVWKHGLHFKPDDNVSII